jgi:aspartate carbamoyltransferase catalytic subunit
MHLTRIADVDREWIESLFALADDMRAEPAACAGRLAGRIVGTFFFEPSTRTRLSFESATQRLGGACLGFADPRASSAAKGESLIDTIRVVERYCDLVVLRHPAEGAAALAAKVASVPIINAGDGGHEHPTQTLFDLYTIRQRFGSLQDRTIGFVGDLRFGRTVHSLAEAASRFGAKLVFAAPDELQMPERLLEELRGRTEARVACSIDADLPALDVLYVTRVQAERMDDSLRQSVRLPPPLTGGALRSAKPDLLVLHPLPRVGEIGYDVDEDPRARYFEQVANGVLVRMALLDRMLAGAAAHPPGGRDEKPPIADPPWRVIDPALSPCANPACVTRTEHSIAPRHERGGLCAYCGHTIPVH